MIVRFYSSSSPTFLVNQELALEIYKIIGKEHTQNGIICQNDFDSISEKLSNPNLKNIKLGGVNMDIRLFPLKKMIKKAKLSDDKFITWEQLR